MSNPIQTIPDMKSGSAETYLKERERTKKIFEKLENLHTDIEVSKLMAQDSGEDLSIVEAPREIIEHFNRGPMMNVFDQLGYFLYRGAVVCEKGKKDDVEKLLDLTCRLTPPQALEKKLIRME